jgi:hypothetical protein
MKWTELVSTGDRTGTILPDQIKAARSGQRLLLTENQNITHVPYALAARISGETKTIDPTAASDEKDGKDSKDAIAKKDDAAKKDDPPADAKKDDPKSSDAAKADSKDGKEGGDKSPDKGKATAEAKSSDDKAGKGKATDAPEIAKKPAPQTHQLNVILVADIDLMNGNVFDIRARSEEEDIGVHFDNIVFVVNALDALSGDDRFIEIRKRKPSHRELTTIEEKRAEYQADVVDKQKEYKDKYEEEKKKTEEEAADVSKKFQDLKKKVDDAQSKGEDLSLDLQMELQEAVINRAVEEQRVKNKEEQLDRDYQRDVEKLDRKLNTDIRHEQNFYKFIAVLFPPIPPFLVAVFVYFRRRAEEREGVAKSRLR